MGNKLGFAIPCGVFDVGLHICHIGTIIVNGSAQVGKNCTLHGNNCIGNNGKDNSKVPLISDNVEFGFGSMVCGKVFIAEGCVIGAGSLIIKDIKEKNSVWVTALASKYK